MKNLEELKEQIQEDIMTWHDGLENNHAYPYLEKIISDHGHEPNAWNDMDIISIISQKKVDIRTSE